MRRVSGCTPALARHRWSTWWCSASARSSFSPFNVVQRLSEAVGKLADDSNLLHGDQYVTEPRRPIVLHKASERSLAERVQAQREQQQWLVPTSLTVDATRQYLIMEWPSPPPPSPSSSSSSSQKCCEAASSPSSSSPVAEPQYRTRVLAEYLRAYTPSTDGTLSSSVLIYGRRGITITNILPMGNYGVRIIFSDNHSGGIYSYLFLHHLSSSPHKFGLMREYIKRLRSARKSRDPPRRRPSQRIAGKRSGGQ